MPAYIGEIRMFAGDFAPRNWALCQGQLMSWAANAALAYIIGNTYGGQKDVSFGLPDLRGRIILGVGSVSELSPVALGQHSGSLTTTISESNLPPHSHTGQLYAEKAIGTSDDPTNNLIAGKALAFANPGSPGSEDQLSPGSISLQPPGTAPINNMQDYLGMNYIICLYGMFPHRS